MPGSEFASTNITPGFVQFSPYFVSKFKILLEITPEPIAKLSEFPPAEFRHFRFEFLEEAHLTILSFRPVLDLA